MMILSVNKKLVLAESLNTQADLPGPTQSTGITNKSGKEFL